MHETRFIIFECFRTVLFVFLLRDQLFQIQNPVPPQARAERDISGRMNSRTTTGGSSGGRRSVLRSSATAASSAAHAGCAVRVKIISCFAMFPFLCGTSADAALFRGFTPGKSRAPNFAAGCRSRACSFMECDVHDDLCPFTGRKQRPDSHRYIITRDATNMYYEPVTDVVIKKNI